MTKELSKDAREWLESQRDEFMIPDIRKFSATEAADLISPEWDEDDVDGEPEAGWYARLSAPGYLDCTDWIGAFETEIEAAETLFELYGTW